MKLKVLYYNQGAVADEAALRFFKCMIGDSEAEIDMIYVSEQPSEVENERRRELAKEQRLNRDVLESEEALKKGEELITSDKISVKKFSLGGDPVEELEWMVNKKDYDLFAVTTFRRGGFTKDVLGVHVKKLVQQLEIPLLVHKGEVEICNGVLIYVPSEIGSEKHFLEFIRYMADMLKESNPSVTFLSVMEEDQHRFEGYTSSEDPYMEKVVEEYDREGAENIRKAQEIFEENGLDSDVRQRRGKAIKGLIDEAKEGRYDMMAFAPSEPGLLENLWQGDESFEVVRDIEIAVLKFPPNYQYRRGERS